MTGYLKVYRYYGWYVGVDGDGIFLVVPQKGVAVLHFLSVRLGNTDDEQ